MTNQPSPSTTPDPRPEANTAMRRRVFWSCLLLVCAFAAGFFQFGLADRLAVPPDKRVNDGEHATFFAVHINPYFIFSEDFHLYAVRAKRILDRGWTDSPLASNENEQPNRSAPLQAAVMMLAVATDGRPVPYSFFVVGMLAIAWSILYMTATRCLPANVSPLTIPVAVMMTVLFESLDGLLHPNGEFGMWPVHRGLRMATLAWTSPLLLSAILATVSLLFRRAHSTGRLILVTILLCALATSDTWAFLLALSCVAVTFLTLGTISVLRRRPAAEGETRRDWLCAAGLALAAMLALGLHQAISSPMTGDLLTRAGFGPEWQEAATSVGNTRHFQRAARYYGAAVVAFAAIMSIWVVPTISRSPLRFRAEAGLRKPTTGQLHLIALAAIPIGGFVLLVEALARMGMDEYHLFQFVWRLQFVLFFCAMLVASEVAKSAIRHWFKDPWRSTRWEVALTALFLLGLLAYHNVRIYKFVSRTVASEFFLTKDEEHLRDWLRERETAWGKYSLATASHELNYLCAYWTRADLWLPEGFPYHSAASLDDIERQMTRVLQVYEATPESWLSFNLHRHVWDQWSWGESRLLSARHGYMYYLMHRALLLDGTVADRAKTRYPSRTTLHVADLRISHDESLREGRFLQHRSGVAAAERIADRLQNLPARYGVKPDVILVDEVSRALGTPALTGYVREFKHGELEAWVRQQDAPRASVRPVQSKNR